MNETINQKLPSREEVKTEILQYLEEKYKEEFISHSIEYRSWSQPNHESMLAYPKEGEPEESFVVYRYEDGQHYEDGYIGYLMKPFYYELFDDIIKDYFDKYQLVIHYNQVYPNFFTKETTFPEFQKYANKSTTIMGVLYVPVTSEKDKEKLENKLFEIVEKIKKENVAIGIISINAYLEADYQKDIENDRFETKKNGDNYPTESLLFELRESWGKVDRTEGREDK
ncbi:hypothetical protein IW492_04880 [Enterococcus sp. BWB1-3]|uniref:hypothetical protein n=1 Tax=Enterococcus sp. BWB1-3 TaxID=2787713 RepID=UPI0019234EF6|nr:hypothetical protein [Enterococcus sp. BWB1-3]MBL1228567.1 hypothetical protein [Enterococcus sp. BWB1-3]